MQLPTALTTQMNPGQVTEQPSRAAIVGGKQYLHIMPLLQRYEPISLGQMGQVSLMDRVDAKYVMRVRELRAVLASLADDYRVLEVDGVRVNRYKTLYFDTDSLDLYKSHHTGRAERYKVRSRMYLDSGASFLEVKRRANKGRTIKDRIQTDTLLTDLTLEACRFVEDRAPWSVGPLQLRLWNEFSRITLVNKGRAERVTFDMDLRFWDDGHSCPLVGLVVAEVKQETLDRSSKLMLQMRAMGMRPTAFSKYCIGTVVLRPDIKHNWFRPTLRRVEQITRGDDGYRVY